MAKKRLTLPKETDVLLAAGDIEGLKALFAKCEPNALYINKFGSNIFSRTPLPREFAFWAKKQGADVNFKDHYGKTPIFDQASAWNGDVQLLIDLGAEVNVAAGGVTPLHYAALYGRPKAVNALLTAGADVEARPKDVLGKARSPLEMALTQNRVRLSTLLLDCGAKITDKARNAVADIGENFERVKRGIQDPDYFREQTESLQKLYDIFGIAPVAEITVHDGVSPIVITETGFAAQYNKLWEYLVPPYGKAKTAQGEAMRIVGKVSHKILDNGGRNWDGDFRRMLRVLPDYFRLGNPLSDEDVAEVIRLAHVLRDGRGWEEPEKLCAYAVAWVLKTRMCSRPFPQTTIVKEIRYGSLMTYWPGEQLRALKKAGDTGPIKVVLGSIHSKMPSVSSVKVGDIIYPVSVIKGGLCVLARLPVEKKECTFDYLIRETGRRRSALIPSGVACWENGYRPNHFYYSKRH